MKFIKKLMGKEERKPPVWDIKPPSERTTARRERPKSFDEPLPTQKPAEEKNPFLDDEFLDTMSLQVDAGPKDDPYQTYTWEKDPENESRKLRNVQIGSKTEKSADRAFNPYDTGKMRRGWKK